MLKRKKNNKGFTLVEVILALVITVLVVTIVAQGFTQGGRAAISAQKQTQAALIASMIMTDVEMGVIAHTSSDEGEWEDDPQFRYKMESEQADIIDVYQISVTVYWDERNKEESYTLTRLLFRPAETEGQ